MPEYFIARCGLTLKNVNQFFSSTPDPGVTGFCESECNVTLSHGVSVGVRQIRQLAWEVEPLLVV